MISILTRIILVICLGGLVSGPLQAQTKETAPQQKNQAVTRKETIASYIKKNQLPSRLEGRARLVLKKSADLGDHRYTYTILVDMSPVKIIIQDKKTLPAVLGAYTLGVKFDPATVQIVKVQGGQTREFAQPPIFTTLEKANKDGLIRFSAVHTNSRTPTGMISVAQLEVRADKPEALQSLELLGDSLATSILFFPDRKNGRPVQHSFRG